MRDKFVFALSLLTISFFLLIRADSFSTSKPNLEQLGLREGDMIRSKEDSDPDVYIINEHGYKRLFLNPEILNFYGHLGSFKNVKPVTKEVRDHFETSALFRNCENGDEKIYALEITGEDEGSLHWINIDGRTAVAEDIEFFKKVFCINNKEFNWYDVGSSYTALEQIPNYSFQPPVPPPKLVVDLEISGSKDPAPVDWNSTLTAVWTSQNAVRCAGMPYIALTNNTIDTDNLPTQGTLSFYARHTVPSDMGQLVVQVLCYDKNGNYADDYVIVPLKKSTLPFIKNISISSGTVAPGGEYKISWESENLNSNVNIILGKGTAGKQGQFWYIAKDIPNTGSYIWDTKELVTPDKNRGTFDYEVESGQYFLFILNDEETIFNFSTNSFEIIN